MTLVNKEIVGKTLKLLNEEGEFLGVFPREEAFAVARKANKDLVCINDSLPEPLCKVIDYGKFVYQEKKNKKSHKPVKIEQKEVQIRPTTDLHDLQIKANHVEKFLASGHKVKISMSLKGREINNLHFAQSNFDKFMTLIKNYSIEKPKSVNDNNIVVFIKGVS